MGIDVSSVGLVMQLEDDLGAERRREIKRRVEENQGVISAHFPPEQLRLMFVEFDAALTSSQEVFRKVCEQSVRARLIGSVVNADTLSATAPAGRRH